MAYYLKYTLHNLEPLRIADDSRSEQGQTACLKHIPGSTMRGYVITEISKKQDLFCKYKEQLFSDSTSFLNAYLCVSGRQMLPSPKGFYEDKTIIDGAKDIKNVLINGDLDEGFKRSSMGNVCDIDTEDGMITFYSVKTDSELKIQIGTDKNMFRNAFIEAGQSFAGAIASDDRELLEEIKTVLSCEVILGNARTSGYGRCSIKVSEIDEDNPYVPYQVNSSIAEFAYLYLLSDTVMRDDAGEYCGLNLRELEELLGVSNLRVISSATSVCDVRGYNRTLAIHIPSATMYEKGSVFKLGFDGSMDSDRIRRLEDTGIGERRNEGFGRVLLLDASYEKIDKKIKGEESEKDVAESTKEASDDDTLRIIARTYYRNQLRKAMRKYVVDNVRNMGGISDSKTRAIEPIVVSNRSNFCEARRILGEYYGHEFEKQDSQKVHKNKGDIRTSAGRIFSILDADINELLAVRTKERSKVMGIPIRELMDEQEAGRMKLELILSELRYDNKGVKRDE